MPWPRAGSGIAPGATAPEAVVSPRPMTSSARLVTGNTGGKGRSSRTGGGASDPPQRAHTVRSGPLGTPHLGQIILVPGYPQLSPQCPCHSPQPAWRPSVYTCAGPAACTGQPVQGQPESSQLVASQPHPLRPVRQGSQATGASQLSSGWQWRAPASPRHAPIPSKTAATWPGQEVVVPCWLTLGHLGHLGKLRWPKCTLSNWAAWSG